MIVIFFSPVFASLFCLEGLLSGRDIIEKFSKVVFLLFEVGCYAQPLCLREDR